MKLYESKIINVECDGIITKEVKKTIYKGLEVYAVKRSRGEGRHIDSIPTAWWCGYVEVPLDMYKTLKPRGYLDISILYKLDDLAIVHGGYTYLNYGIPLVLVDDRRLFLGWDYNHWLDTEDCVTYQEILKEGMKVIDSMLAPKSRDEKVTKKDV